MRFKPGSKGSNLRKRRCLVVMETQLKTRLWGRGPTWVLVSRTPLDPSSVHLVPAHLSGLVLPVQWDQRGARDGWPPRPAHSSPPHLCRSAWPGWTRAPPMVASFPRRSAGKRAARADVSHSCSAGRSAVGADPAPVIQTLCVFRSVHTGPGASLASPIKQQEAEASQLRWLSWWTAPRTSEGPDSRRSAGGVAKL